MFVVKPVLSISVSQLTGLMFVVSRLQRAPPLRSGQRCLSCLLEVQPASSLLDCEVSLSGRELEPGAVVRLETRLVDRGQHWHFQSVCLYQTDDSGEFSTARQPPLPASQYRGLHRSGPLWSLQPCPGSRPRLWPEDIRKALQYQLSLSCPQSGQVLATARAEKYFLTQAVRRVEVREGPLRAVLFLPPNPGPAVITIYGGVNRGRVPEDRWVASSTAGAKLTKYFSKDLKLFFIILELLCWPVTALSPWPWLSLVLRDSQPSTHLSKSVISSWRWTSFSLTLTCLTELEWGCSVSPWGAVSLWP